MIRRRIKTMLNYPKMRLEEIDSRLKELPKGTLTYKTINGKKQPYIQRTIQGKSQSVYVKLEGREKILLFKSGRVWKRR